VFMRNKSTLKNDNEIKVLIIAKHLVPRALRSKIMLD